MSHILLDLKAFLDHSPTSWHAARQLGNRFAMTDFIPLDEKEKWKLEPGAKYFIVRGGSVCAFCLPTSRPTSARILGAHTDSPALKLKPHPILSHANMTFLGVEVYGHPLLSSWLNRDLYLAGRIIVQNAEGILDEKLVLLDDTILMIPQLAPHLDRTVNEKGLILNPQEHLCPILGLEADPASPVLENLFRRYFSFQTLLSYELFLVSAEPCRFIGHHHEMLASYRIDNLGSAHAAASALGSLLTPHTNRIQMALFWDHEEIGSHSTEGAGSPFLSDILERIAHCLKMNVEEEMILKNHSLFVSIDMAHAFNPNYKEKYDPEHQPLLGKGIVIKSNANQKYASNAPSTAIVVQACDALKIPYQTFVSRSDIPCGSTVGPIVAERLGISTVDIGCPQLSMHSIREVMSSHDYISMVHLLTHLLKEANAF